VLHDAKGVALKEKLFLFQQIAYACFANQPDQPGGPWQQIYTTKGLYNINSGADIANAPWTCPLPSPGNPVSAASSRTSPCSSTRRPSGTPTAASHRINGVVQPTLTVPAGEIQRWRFVHAGIHDTVNLQVMRATPTGGKNLIATSALSGNRQQQKADLLASCDATPATLVPQFEIASDGLTRTRMRTVRTSQVGGVLESNYLQPGYRSDILVVFPSDGDYCLLNQAAPAAERVSNGGGGQGPSTPQLLAYVHVRGGHAVTGDLQA